MSQLHRHAELLLPASRLAFLVAVAASAWVVWQHPAYPGSWGEQGEGISKAVPVWVGGGAPAIPSDRWSIFSRAARTDANPNSPINQKYRLAGTFFAMGNEDGDVRKAILDELASGSQRIVQEAEVFDGLRVVKIYRDHVILAAGVQESELWLGFKGPGTVSEASGKTGADASKPASPDNWLGGQQVGEHSWVFSRSGIIGYYQQLMDEPERLVKVFDSLKPIYDEANGISGYRLEVEGEREFFDAVGLKEGDVVRSVNSMKMTSRRRAEYFIGEFVKDRVNAFLIEVERGGKPEKLIYHVR